MSAPVQVGSEAYLYEWTLVDEDLVGEYQHTPMMGATFHAHGDFNRVAIEGSMFPKDDAPAQLGVLTRAVPVLVVPAAMLYFRVRREGGESAVVRMVCGRAK